MFSDLKVRFSLLSSLVRPFSVLRFNFVSTLSEVFEVVKVKFLSSLGLRVLSKFNFVSSCREDSKKFSLFITPVIDKDVWGSFVVWQDTYIAKNDTWGG